MVIDLKQTIHEELQAILSELDEPKKGEFGKYLFGQERELPSKKNIERNTPEETSLSRDLFYHYHGDMDQLNDWIPKLVELDKKGLYKDILHVPGKYKYAYRALTVKHETITKMLGYDPTGIEPNELYEEDSATYFASGQGRPHASWTVDVAVFKKILEDWGTWYSKGTDYLVFVAAPVQGNTFLLNPDKTNPFSKKFNYQREIISVGDVDCNHIWFTTQKSHSSIYWKDKDKFEKNATDHVSQLAKQANRGNRKKKA